EEQQAALAEPIRSVRYGPQVELDAPYVAEMVRAELIRRFGPAAYTAGLKVTTTIDSRLQAASNRAIRVALTAYDERHGYRGPVARVDLAAEDGAAAGEERWREILGDYPTLVGLEAALVLEVSPEAARIFLRSRGEQTIGLDAVQWAAPYINDSAVGARPSAVSDVLAAGAILRFRIDSAGNLRLAQIPDVQGAFAAVDPRDGAIVALNGGIDFGLNKFNRAVQARRQPGSAFKPFIYSAALEHGFTTASIVNDAPLSIEDAGLETVWRPENYNRRFHGETRLREALVESLNLVSVRVVRAIGIDNAIRHIRRFGFDDVALPRNLSMSLGAGGIAPLDLAGGMAAFANGGFRVEPYFIERIEDANGEVLYQAEPEIACLDCVLRAAETRTGKAPPVPELIDDVAELYPRLRVAPQAITPRNAYLSGDMLQYVVRRGTGAAACRALRRVDLAGKTGTSNDRRDTWFAGFNGDVAAVAWVGFDQDRPLGGNEQGGVTAIPMWIEFMAEALEGVPENRVERPPGIVEVRINPETGLVASDASRTSMFEKFEIDRVPAREADPVFSGPAGPSGPSDTPGRSQPHSIF